MQNRSRLEPYSYKGGIDCGKAGQGVRGEPLPGVRSKLSESLPRAYGVTCMTSPIGDTGCRRSKMPEISMPRPYRVIPTVPIAGYRNWTSGCDGECACATGSSGNGRAHGGGISPGSFQC